MNGKTILVLAVALGIGVLFIAPTRQSNAQLKNELSLINKRHDASNKRFIDLQKVQLSLEEEDNLTEKVPRKREQDRLLEDIEFLAARSGFVVSQMSFSERNEKEIGANAVDINLALEGNRSQVAAFFRAAESNERLLEIKNYSLKLNGGQAGNTATLNVTLRGYYLP